MPDNLKLVSIASPFLLGFIFIGLLWQMFQVSVHWVRSAGLGILGGLVLIACSFGFGFALFALKRRSLTFYAGAELCIASILSWEVPRDLKDAREIWSYLALGASVYLFSLGVEDLWRGSKPWVSSASVHPNS